MPRKPHPAPAPKPEPDSGGGADPFAPYHTTRDVVEKQVHALYGAGAGDFLKWLMELIAKVGPIASPVIEKIIALLLSRQPAPKVTGKAHALEAMGPEIEDVAKELLDAFEVTAENQRLESATAPGQYGGPNTIAAIERACHAALELADHNVAAFAAMMDQVINQYVAKTP